jgi:hypothetical protein
MCRPKMSCRPQGPNALYPVPLGEASHSVSTRYAGGSHAIVSRCCPTRQFADHCPQVRDALVRLKMRIHRRGTIRVSEHDVMSPGITLTGFGDTTSHCEHRRASGHRIVNAIVGSVPTRDRRLGVPVTLRSRKRIERRSRRRDGTDESA